MYAILKIFDNCSFQFATENFRFIATFTSSSAYETHQGRTQQVKQEAAPEASLSTLLLRHVMFF